MNIPYGERWSLYWNGISCYYIICGPCHGGTTEEGNCCYLVPLSHRAWMSLLRDASLPGHNGVAYQAWTSRGCTKIPGRFFKQGSCGQHGAHLGPTGPRWAPCWPHELRAVRNDFFIVLQIPWKFYSAFTYVTVMWSLWNVAYGRTNMLSWHSQNVVAIW